MSIYEREQLARKQGFYFAVALTLPTYEQFGHVMHATREQAFDDGALAVRKQECRAFKVYRTSLVAPFASEDVTWG